MKFCYYTLWTFKMAYDISMILLLILIAIGAIAATVSGFFPSMLLAYFLIKVLYKMLNFFSNIMGEMLESMQKELEELE